MKKLLIGVALLSSLALNSAYADTNYTLHNGSGDTLKFDKIWQANSKCNTKFYSPDVGPGYKVNFSLDRNIATCQWAGGGYKVMDSNGNYKGYLSINVSHGSGWIYSYTYDAGPDYTFGTATAGTFHG